MRQLFSFLFVLLPRSRMDIIMIEDKELYYELLPINVPNILENDWGGSI